LLEKLRRGEIVRIDVVRTEDATWDVSVGTGVFLIIHACPRSDCVIAPPDHPGAPEFMLTSIKLSNI
jgi:hypothetical protein